MSLLEQVRRCLAAVGEIMITAVVARIDVDPTSNEQYLDVLQAPSGLHRDAER